MNDHFVPRILVSTLLFLTAYSAVAASEPAGVPRFKEQPVIRLRAARAFLESTDQQRESADHSAAGGFSFDRGSHGDSETDSESEKESVDQTRTSGGTRSDGDDRQGIELVSAKASSQDSRIDDAVENGADENHRQEDLPSEHRRLMPDEVFSNESEDACTEESSEAFVSRFRQSFFQGASVSMGTVGTGDNDTLSVRHFQVSATGAIPLGGSETITDNMLMVTPGFRADYIDAPPLTDIPNELFEPSLTFFWRRVINDRLSSSLIVTPSIRSDFTTGDDAFRIFGLALLTWETIPDELWMSAGGVYLDRADLSALPAVGLTWKPTPVWKIDVQFPQPKISYRLEKNGGESESWLYLGGGFGGNTWAVTRASGASDQLTLSELRMVVGYEKLIAGNRGGFAEMGWAFDRQMEYLNVPGEQAFDDALVARVGISF
ncbi:MAG: hypothetical protein ACK526_04195 [Planctomyces sp.]